MQLQTVAILLQLNVLITSVVDLRNSLLKSQRRKLYQPRTITLLYYSLQMTASYGLLIAVWEKWRK